MIESDHHENPKWVQITLSGIHELSDYQNGVLGILKEIEINESGQVFKEDLKLIHRILNYLLVDNEFVSRNQQLVLQNPPKFNLPPKIQLAISLIKAELKNLKFVNDMNRQGIDASTGLWDFGSLILGLVGFDNQLSDELSEWYFNCQNDLIETIDQWDEQTFSEQAFYFYINLEIKRREMID
ncbi:hypothetical protein QQ020_07305 [Fulvivirgaceae bacterium BMA12]|uniref:Uncharacterized protein n=1 Tax=Agaribacillus aureus TaxID=3051825 RepID=A0ABT8L5X9_9BACT|nr:hypothetical protein [Fulvivirgaceae bacterium BMA12]